MPIATVALWALASLITVPLAYLSIELAVGLFAKAPGRASRLANAPQRVAILIPAHNEGGGISRTVDGLRRAIARGTEILVVADNCSDDTAALARDAGATVVERNDLSRRGKGYALAFGRDHLSTSPPDVVVVVDADCILSAGSDSLLAARVMKTRSAVQASNLVVSSPDAPALVQISNFAMLVKNIVRARGMERIGGGVPLFGTGMAFPWDIFARAPLASPDMVEDMQLGLWLARSGRCARLEERAQVTSGAAALEDSAGQRRRWEHGFLKTAGRNAVPLLANGLVKRSRYQAAFGAHLLVPPLALLYLASTGVLVGLVFAGLLVGTLAPAMMLGAAWAGASLLLLLAWVREGTDVLTPRALLLVPFYALWKIPIYVGFFIARQSSWNRTRRKDGDA